MRKVTFYIEDAVYRELKSVLALKDETLSSWLRGIIQNFVDKNKK